jgi:2-oxoglutarate dehydrogenase E1 component
MENQLPEWPTDRQSADGQDHIGNGDVLNSQSLEFVEAQYADYLRNPQEVPADWRAYFGGFRENGSTQNAGNAAIGFPRRGLFHQARSGVGAPRIGEGIADALLQERVDRLIHAYRVRGHIIAHIDPLGAYRADPPELKLDYYGLSEADLDRPVTMSTAGSSVIRTPRQILRQMRETYCRFIGVQFMHIDELAVRKWLMRRMESTQNRIKLSHQEQLRILTRLTDATVFEEFLQKKFIGAKSFSLEGAESLIPLLDLLIERAGEQGTEEIVLGMAHRGRLNVLANIMGKAPRAIFGEFEDVDTGAGSELGDVKYHLGHSNDWKTSSGRTVHLSLCFNPSHLEYVNTVAIGRMRAKQDRFGDTDRRRGMALLIHGDAAFAGEGIIQEMLNMSGLPAYTVGGTIHVIVNNQIGFTTLPPEGRSSTYATDVAKMLQIPIFHVNGEHPEAAAQAVELALEFRREFQRDVVIDMYCYRRRGHNEGDEPALTQPLLYRAIESSDPVRDNYLEQLLLLGEVTTDEALQIGEQRRALLEQELALARSPEYHPEPQRPVGIWAGYASESGDQDVAVSTGVDSQTLAKLLAAQTELPAGFHPHPKIDRWLKLRCEMAQGQRGIDWSASEALAFASLVATGMRLRLTGQDCARGTFSQRHAVLHDVVDGHTCIPLQHVAPQPAAVEIWNSPLSEAGVLGFEYGYSLDCPDGLVLWEAQYGDFCNAAQVIIDQFIVSAEQKWRRLSGIVLLLPHGLEGQGPEHSSARIERFLDLAADDNLQIVQPSTPAQYFHVLRRQVLQRRRKPLVVLTPKSLLRNSAAVSSLADLARPGFVEVIPDGRAGHAHDTQRVLLCSGKVYYDILHRRDELHRDDVALVRIEQLYPLSGAGLESALADYAAGTPAVWVQEEPANMGAWRYLRIALGESLFGRLPLSGVFRPASSSPATGSNRNHKREQEQLLRDAFGG